MLNLPLFVKIKIFRGLIVVNLKVFFTCFEKSHSSDTMSTLQFAVWIRILCVFAQCFISCSIIQYWNVWPC